MADGLWLRLDVGDLCIHQGVNVDATEIVALTGSFASPDSIPLKAISLVQLHHFPGGNHSVRLKYIDLAFVSWISRLPSQVKGTL